MAEFEILINQSLVDKTLNNLEYNPLVLVDFKKGKLSDNKENFDILKKDELIDIGISKSEYFETGIEIIEDEYLIDEEKMEFSEQPNFLNEIESGGLGITDSSYFMNDDKFTIYQEKSDCISYAADLLASYVITHPVEFDADTVVEAEAIFNREDQFLFDSKLLGFGSFFRKVGRAGKKVFKKAGRWAKRQIKKVVNIGNPELINLKLLQYGKPVLKLSNPINIRRINTHVEKLKIRVPYYIKFPWSPIKWRYLTISMNNRIEARIDGDLHFNSKELKIFTSLVMNSFKVKVEIVGVKVPIGLTGITNKILKEKEFEIYDASGLATPIKVKGLKYQIGQLTPVGLDNGLRLDINIDVAK